jgi:phosphatidylglycerophosphatase A
VKLVFDKVAIILATGFGVGYAPRAPGTFGSLIALPIGWWVSVQSFGLGYKFLMAGILTAFALAIIHMAEQALRTHDDQRIVLDEVAGQFIAICWVPNQWYLFLGGFLLFRLFDIWKPGLIGYVDQKLPGAMGTLFDDVIAGLFAGACLFAIWAGFLYLRHSFVLD